MLQPRLSLAIPFAARSVASSCSWATSSPIFECNRAHFARLVRLEKAEMINNGTDKLNLDYATDENGPLEPWPLDVYRDIDTTIAFSDNTTNSWYWTLKNTSTPHIATIGNTASDSFDTDIDFQPTDSSSVWRQPLFGYPLHEVSDPVA